MNYADYQMLASLAVLVLVMLAFFREWVAPHIASFVAMTAMLALGILNTNEVLGTFSNSAPITIAAMFILTGALERTGVIDQMGGFAIKLADKGRTIATITMIFGVMFLSAFMNNTPMVVVLTPVVITMARRLKDYPSQYLIPLSYATILGGTCSLIGTSTNILTDGVSQKLGLAPFGIFEITGAGTIMAAVGGIYMLLFGRKLLPNRELLDAELINEQKRMRFTAEVMIPQNSPLVGKTINDIQLPGNEHEVLDLIRNDMGSRTAFGAFISRFKEALETSPAGPRSTLRDIKIRAGDRLVIKTNKQELLELKDAFGIAAADREAHVTEPMSVQETTVVEGIIGPNCPFIGRKLTELRIRRRYGCYVLAVHRANQHITGNFEDLALKEGDILLLEGAPDELERLFEHQEIMSLSQHRKRQFNRRKAPIALGMLLMVVVLSSFEVMPIAGLALIGAAVVIITGCVRAEQIPQMVDWRILLLIFGMLGVSQGLENTGLIKLAVERMADVIIHLGLGPWFVLMLFYLFCSGLTEVMSNNATAVLLTPIAVGVAHKMGVDPRPFVVAVMFSASASFATPIGYQTNTYVFNAGNYTFKDFLKFGSPMNLLMAVVAGLTIPLFWDF